MLRRTIRYSATLLVESVTDGTAPGAPFFRKQDTVQRNYRPTDMLLIP